MLVQGTCCGYAYCEICWLEMCCCCWILRDESERCLPHIMFGQVPPEMPLQIYDASHPLPHFSPLIHGTVNLFFLHTYTHITAMEARRISTDGLIVVAVPCRCLKSAFKAIVRFRGSRLCLVCSIVLRPLRADRFFAHI